MKSMKHDICLCGRMILAMLVLTGCSTITEFPGENPTDPTLVGLNIEVTLSEETTDMTDCEDLEGWAQQRLVVEAYETEDLTQPTIRKEMLLEHFLQEEETVTVPLELHAEQYRLTAWIDYVKKDEPGDLYYCTENSLRNIRLNSDYRANCEEKDCFTAVKDLDLTVYSGQWNTNLRVGMKAERPVGKLVLIADDVEKFITRAQSRGDQVSRADINGFKARVIYQGYTPVGYDACGCELNDAATGICYESTFRVLNENEAMVAFDYLLAEKEGTSYEVALLVYDEEGKLLNEVGGQKVTVKSNQVTVLKADFLTGEYKPGISIDTDYDGTIDVELPD